MVEDYKKKYKSIIDKAKSENRKKGDGVYYENHHIVPDFMFKNRKRSGPKGHLDGDPNAPSNIVLLTFQEHLMAHYYLYETLKHTRYKYSSGSALQFFFTHATGSHKRQINLSDLDENFLLEMSHLREIGIKSISESRKGKMPVVDAVTRVSIGSVPVDHPRVLSGEWIHHSKGKKQTWAPPNMKGSLNTNFKEMNDGRVVRVYKCVRDSIFENHLIANKFEIELKKEFTEFKKISRVWVLNNFTSMENLIQEYNKIYGTNHVYSSYFKSSTSRHMSSITHQRYMWLTDGVTNIRIEKIHEEMYKQTHPNFRQGRIK